MNNLTILIADDHILLRNGFEVSIKTIPIVGKVFQAADGLEVMAVLAKQQIDVVFMDVKMPLQNGIVTTREVIKKYPTVKVIALTNYDNEETIIEMFKAGVSGYLQKDTQALEIEKAITEVLEGGKYYSKMVSEILMKNLLKTEGDYINTNNKLNEREIDVLKYICLQMSTKQIADTMCLSAKTIEGYRLSLHHKTNSKNIAGLVLYALENGFIENHNQQHFLG